MKKITRDMVDWSLSAEVEYEGPEGSFVSGDDAADAEEVARIRKDLEWNEWAWCVAHVRGTFNGLTADAYLGGCSYDSAEQFKEPGGYYDDMVAEVLDDLNAQIAKLAEVLT